MLSYWGLWHEYRNWQFALWIASLLLLFAAFWDRTAPAGAGGDEREAWSGAEILVLAVIVATAAFFRLHRLDTLPPALWVDECHAVGRAGVLMTRKPFLPFGCSPLTWVEAWVQTSNLYLYFVGLTLALFGHGYFGIKMVSVVPGILGVPALYLFCRELAGRNVAVFAGFFFAVGHWNVRISRWGWDEVLMTTLQILAFYYLARGVRVGRRQNLVAAGITMGLCLYTYIASRLVLASALTCFAIQIATVWRRARTRFAEAWLFSLATLLTVAPLSVFYIQNPHFFNVRTKEVTIFKLVEEAGNLQPLWDNLLRHLLMFHVRGDSIPKHALPYQPMLDSVTGALFVLGFAITLWKWRSFPHLLCQCWFWIGLMAGVLSVNGPNPHTYRTGNVAPVVMAMAALPAGLLVTALLRPGRWVLARRSFAAAATVAGIGVVFWLNFENYFIRYPKVESLWNDMLISRGVNVVRTIRKIGTARPIYLDRSFKDAGFWCLIGDTPVTEWSPDLDPMPRDTSQDLVYFLTPPWRMWVEGVYPQSRVTALKTPLRETYAYMAEIPASDLRASLGLSRSLTKASTRSTDPHTADVALQQTVFEGAFHEKEPRFLTFGVTDRRLSGIWLNGKRVLHAGQRLSNEHRTVTGFNSVRFVVDGEVDTLPEAFQRRRAGRSTHPIPVENLTPPGPSTQSGLRAVVYAGPRPAAKPIRVIDATPPSAVTEPPEPPYSVVWEGSLRIDRAGEYLLAIAINDSGRLVLDGSEVVHTNGGRYEDASVMLSAGNHSIIVEQHKTGGGPSYVQLSWIPPGQGEVIEEGQWKDHGFSPFTESVFFRLPFTGTGLRARYYSNPSFEGDPRFTTIKSSNWLSHAKGDNFSVELDGSLQFPKSGDYWLGTTSDDGSWLYLNGELIVDNSSAPTITPVGKAVTVEAGKQDFRVRYIQRGGGSHLTLFWALDGDEPRPIPSMFLYPPAG